GDARVFLAQVLEYGLDRAAAGLHRGLALGAASWGWEFERERTYALLSRSYTSAGWRAPSTSGSNSSRAGRITAGFSRQPATASWVFRPLPVMHRTISSSRGMRPCSMSFRATATVTPPAVSAKIPSVRPNRAMASAISASVTSSAQPPDSRITLAAKY